MPRPRVLFVCTHNGARSMIAESFARKTADDRIEAHCTSFESGKIGPLPIAVMDEVGICLPSEPPKSVFARIKDREPFDYVVALCDPHSPEQVSIFLSAVDKLYHQGVKRLNWAQRASTATEEQITRMATTCQAVSCWLKKTTARKAAMTGLRKKR